MRITAEAGHALYVVAGTPGNQLAFSSRPPLRSTIRLAFADTSSIIRARLPPPALPLQQERFH